MSMADTHIRKRHSTRSMRKYRSTESNDVAHDIVSCKLKRVRRLLEKNYSSVRLAQLRWLLLSVDEVGSQSFMSTST